MKRAAAKARRNRCECYDRLTDDQPFCSLERGHAGPHQTESGETFETDFGSRLRHERIKRGLTQGALSELTGGKVTQGTISRIERGDQEQSVHTPLLADALGVNAAYLATGRGSKQHSDMKGLSRIVIAMRELADELERAIHSRKNDEQTGYKVE